MNATRISRAGLSRADRRALRQRMIRDTDAYVDAHPKTSTQQIFVSLTGLPGSAGIRPLYGMFVFTQKVGWVISARGYALLQRATTDVQAEAIIKKYVKKSTDRTIRKSLMREIKDVLSANGRVIYGGPFGQVHQHHLTDKIAAQYMAPQVRALSRSSSKWEFATGLIQNANHHKRESTAVRGWATFVRVQGRVNTAFRNIGLFI